MDFRADLQRRRLLRTFGQGTAACLAGPLAPAVAQARRAPLRIGWQPGAFNLVLQRSLGLLGRRLPGLRIEWTEFSGGLQLLLALADGRIDFGATGEAAPVFAQAAGLGLRVVANEPPQPDSAAVLVRPADGLRQPQDLRGRRVAAQAGSDAQHLLARWLGDAGLRMADVQWVDLAPREARIAFEQRELDAWAVGDPHYAAAETGTRVRVLATSRGLVANCTCYVADAELATDAPTLRGLLGALVEGDAWVQSNPKEAAQRYAVLTDLGLPTVYRVLGRRDPAPTRQSSAGLVGAQQRVADGLRQLGLVSKKVRVADVIDAPAPDAAPPPAAARKPR